MRLSFDIDDTLIFYDQQKRQKCRAKLFLGERLRDGTLDLFRELQKDHELWLYTSSLRPCWKLRLQFRLKGIRIDHVVNHEEHLELLKSLKLPDSPTKLPNKYGIDLHIDDSPGVAEEGRRYGFRVLIIDPHDEQWVQKVKEKIETLSCR